MALTGREPLLNDTQSTPIATSLEWIDGVLFGPVAIGLCVLAVAFVGFAMLTGRLPVRQGALVMVGTFILLGAPMIAAGLMTTVEGGNEPPPPAPVSEDLQPREELPPASRDPYSGA